MSCPCYLITEVRYKELTDTGDNIAFRALRVAFDVVHTEVLPSLLGQTCIDELCAAIAADNLTVEQQLLLDKIENLLAYTIKYTDISKQPGIIQGPQGIGQMNGNGVFPFQPAEDYQRNQLLAFWGKRSTVARQNFETWLYENRADYPCWEGTCEESPAFIGVYSTAHWRETNDCGCND